MNKKQSWLALGITPMVALFTVIFFSQPTRAISSIITCNTKNHEPQVNITLTKENQTKDITILSFPTKYFSTDDAIEKCQNTAKELQNIYTTGNAKYLTADNTNKLKGQLVVCAVERRGIGCNHHNAKALFTLNQSLNPSQILYEMLGSDFKQSLPLDVRTVSRIYSDIHPRPWWKFF